MAEDGAHTPRHACDCGGRFSLRLTGSFLSAICLPLGESTTFVHSRMHTSANTSTHTRVCQKVTFIDPAYNKQSLFLHLHKYSSSSRYLQLCLQHTAPPSDQADMMVQNTSQPRLIPPHTALSSRRPTHRLQPCFCYHSLLIVYHRRVGGVQ